ncbi:hypothetical protein B0920_21010 [Massilia sp. KIM]|jgi:hypothetical protein|uniref:hypothetical protein n=1 Tax=Massilia sp. KIM TaxID=1955422 RepID=UPI00098EF5AB|nr:hypothetical protein [Massilia sp. KIM]OON59765.1 hypothetical protein B0920_21010 [Massilia sp. KIM]
MDNYKLEHEGKVKEISDLDGCICIDLLSGLRLMGPMLSDDELAAVSKKPKRRMIVSGHEAIVEQALAFG